MIDILISFLVLGFVMLAVRHLSQYFRLWLVPLLLVGTASAQTLPILQTPDAATFEAFWASVAVLPFAEYLRVFTIFILSAVAYYSRGAIRQAWGLLEDWIQTKRDALRTDEKEST